MTTPNFINSLKRIESNKLIVTILNNKEIRTQIMTGNKIVKKSYRGCEIITTDNIYFNSLCNTFGVTSKKVIHSTFDCNEVSFIQAEISKYNIILKLV